MSRKTVEISINTLIQKILNKVETLSGFGSANVQLRFLLQRLKFYEDPNKKEMISFENFQQFLLRLNCISINLREVEELFSLFDTEMIGSINYLEFAYTLYNSGPYPVLANDALEVMNMIRSYLMKLDYHESIRFYWWVRALSDGKLAGDYFVKEVYNILDHKIPLKSLQLLVDRFDFERNGYIHVPSFLRSFTSGINLDRKRLIKALFDTLDTHEQGFITVDDVRECYQVKPSQTISFRGESFERPLLPDFLRYLLGPNDLRNDEISWLRFYTYYACLSMSIVNNEFYEFVIRNSWHGTNMNPETDGFLSDPNTVPNGGAFSPGQADHLSFTATASSVLPTDKRPGAISIPSYHQKVSTFSPKSISHCQSITPPAIVNAAKGYSPALYSPTTTASSSSNGVTSPPKYSPLSNAAFLMGIRPEPYKPPTPSIATSKASTTSSSLSSPSQFNQQQHQFGGLSTSVPGGIASMNSPSVAQRRIVVTHSNGEDEIIDIIDELGKTRLDYDSMKEVLTANGIDDIARIRY